MVVPATRYRRPLNRSVRRAARSRIRDPDDGSRLGTWIGPWSHQLRGQPMLATLQPGRSRPSVPTLQGKDHPPGAPERIAPADEPVERRDGSRDHDVVASGMILRPGSHDSYLCGDLQLVHHLHQKRGSPQQRLEERNRRSGRKRASGIPGSPAPLPTSITVASGSIKPPSAALLRMCRSHSRLASSGPSSPRDSLGGQYVDILTNAGGLVPVQLENNLLGSCRRGARHGP